MTEGSDTINALSGKLDRLSARQAEISKELAVLREEIIRMQKTDAVAAAEAAAPLPTVVPPQPIPPRPVPSQPLPAPTKQVKNNLEKFIGENLINKIGIVITVAGVAIGVKFAIDHQLISPLTRIVLGYLFGLGLLVIAYRLKKNYAGFSAVLLSGTVAILYFVTYAAYDFYDFIPKLPAFALMFAFTAFISLAAVHYNRQIIAHIGMAGAYAIPFLLSDGSEKVVTLFSYIAVINLGILALSFKKHWKALYYVAFPLTWIIYATWYIMKFDMDTYFAEALVFLGIFFVIFYLMFLSYRLLRGNKYNVGDIILLLSNAFIFYGFGYSTLNAHAVGESLLGLFTLLNALIHFLTALWLYRQKQADRNVFYLVTGMVLVFVTIAAPVQLEGNWVTLAWACEAALLFWTGRAKGAPVYVKMSFPLMIFALFSLIQDWAGRGDHITPVFNAGCLTSLLLAAIFGSIVLTDKKRPAGTLRTGWEKIILLSAAGFALLSLYMAFFYEIYYYCEDIFSDSYREINTEDGYEIFFNHNTVYFRNVWLLSYSLFFFAAWSAVNFLKIKSRTFSAVLLGTNILTTFLFLTVGLYALSELRENYYDFPDESSLFNIGVRYIAFLPAIGMLAVIFRQGHHRTLGIRSLCIPVELFLHLSVLWLVSNELIHWLDIAEVHSYKLGLSILWGCYSLLLIALGILKKKKYLRIGAISLFGITLCKLFLYDIRDLDTIAKTIVFVVLGILLLLISFLYNKYKHVIDDEPSKPDADKENTGH
ncbi:MAG: DUF2339 domain-containing protein [Bacteroidales bacterium]|jgi:uncharacterized membrane protein|nr:DUF2339 domain-containing protein [Bacteroidales bacterium]